MDTFICCCFFLFVSPQNASKVESLEPLLEEEDKIKATLEDQFFHNAVIFEFVLCAGVSVALGLLFFWHARLISMGQTSIETHVNNKERARLKKKNKVSIYLVLICKTEKEYLNFGFEFFTSYLTTQIAFFWYNSDWFQSQSTHDYNMR